MSPRILSLMNQASAKDLATIASLIPQQVALNGFATEYWLENCRGSSLSPIPRLIWICLHYPLKNETEPLTLETALPNGLSLGQVVDEWMPEQRAKLLNPAGYGDRAYPSDLISILFQLQKLDPTLVSDQQLYDVILVDPQGSWESANKMGLNYKALVGLMLAARQRGLIDFDAKTTYQRMIGGYEMLRCFELLPYFVAFTDFEIPYAWEFNRPRDSNSSLDKPYRRKIRKFLRQIAENPGRRYLQIQRKYGAIIDAAQLWIGVFYAKSERIEDSNLRRFIEITQQLPMELQHLVCQWHTGYVKGFIYPTDISGGPLPN